ncbi:MAG: 5-(carboxyamino)imidazole ribonucleotide synthase [Pseudomonadota bacterium]
MTLSSQSSANPIPRGSSIGIIGGGQLGRMLAMAAARLGYKTIALDPAADCPAAQVVDRVICADYSDASAVAELSEASDVITFEFENVDVEAIRSRTGETAVYPPLDALAISQDRLIEKRFLNENGLQAAEFATIDNLADLKTALIAFDGHGILKTRRFGYDGKGQVRISPDGPSAEEALKLIKNAPAVLEKLIDFECEVSVIVTRSLAGDVKCFDPARNTHENGILSVSAVPSGVAIEIETKAQGLATTLVEKLNYVGTLGLEFFVTRDGELKANEFAPRVHNSGHWTEAACSTSQFEQHIRAITGLPLGDPSRHSDASMANLLGDDIEKIPTLAWQDNLVVHDYGKTEARPGRKMGHYTRILPKT